MKTLLITDSVTKRFGGLVAVDGLDFELAEGQIASVIGPNGAGKTTFFNMLTGLYRPSAGSVSSADSCGFIPAVGSSSSRIFGSDASARAISTRRCSP